MSYLSLIIPVQIRAFEIAAALHIADARIRCTFGEHPAWTVARIEGPWLGGVEHFRRQCLDAFPHATTVWVPDTLEQSPPELVVTDVDATLIQEEVIEELARHAGHFDQVQAITAAAMNGEIDFDQSLRQRVATLAGVPQSVLTEVALSVNVRDGVEDFIELVHRGGGHFGVVSGGFSQVLSPLAERLGLDFYLANNLEVDGGFLTGKVSGPIVNAEAKVRTFHQWMTQVRTSVDHTVAMGDGANDLPFMKEAGLAVAFCAKPTVLSQIPDHLMVPSFAPMLPILGLD